MSGILNFWKAILPAQLRLVATALDDFIKSKNHLYRELREANVLSFPLIRCISKNGFYSYMKEEG